MIITASSITERRSEESREKIILTYNYFNIDYYLSIILQMIIRKITRSTKRKYISINKI